MVHFSRSASIIRASLALAALLVLASPAGAKLAVNKLAVNGIAQSGVPADPRVTTGSALSDLNGIAVEAAILPDAALR